MTEATDIKKYQRAEQAQRLLDNEAYKEAWEAVHDMFVRQWESSPQRDVEGRERLFLMLSCMKAARSYLEGYLIDGKIAKKRLSDIEPKRFGIF